MKEDLDNIIGTLSDQTVPKCPDSLEANVLRRVRIEKAATREESILGWVSGLIPNTGFALSAIALVVAVSATATAASTLAMASDRKTELNRALGFDTITMTQVVTFERH